VAKNSIPPGFPGTFLVLYVLKNSSSYPAILLRAPNALCFLTIHKNTTPDNAYEHFDFPAVAENTCRSTTTINQPLTPWNRRGGESRLVNWVRPETAKNEKRVCKEESAGGLSVFSPAFFSLLFHFLYLLSFYLGYLVVVILINYSYFFLTWYIENVLSYSSSAHLHVTASQFLVLKNGIPG
jgi:hypothetical protein